MDCQGVFALFGKGFSRTTVAERNAACVHIRACEDCQQKIVEHINAMPIEEVAARSGPALANLIRDRSDPEWK